MANPKTKKETDINVPVGTVAKVVERRDANDNVTSRIATYEAGVEQNDIPETDTETENEFSDLESETFENETFESFENIPKTKLERMFDNIRYAVETRQADDSFFAYLSRMPDAMNTRYNIPCAFQTDLGSFQFCSRDLLNFASAIQERNGNSGGIFNVTIYQSNQQPLVIERRMGRSIHPIETQVGLVNYAVPNPAKIETPNTNNGQSGNIENMMLAYMEKTDARFEAMLNHINRPAEKSEVEQLVMRTAIERLMNPPAQNNGFEQTMMTMLAMPAMVDGFASKMFPKEAPPVEPSMIDHVTKLLENPTVANAVGGLINVSEQFAISKLQGQAENIDTDADDLGAIDQTPAPAPVDIEMQNLINGLITELESDNKLDASNEFIKRLQVEYPTQSQTLIQTVKSLDFETTLKVLGAQMGQFEPNPIIPFVDVAETTKQNAYIWNGRGGRLKERLQEFYDFVRSLN